MRALLVALCVLVGCSSGVQITKAGQRVAIVPEAQVAGCAFVSQVRSERGGGFRSFDANMLDARIELQNKAARAGATHLVITETRDDPTQGGWSRSCQNCVEMFGTGYRCARVAVDVPD